MKNNNLLSALLLAFILFSCDSPTTETEHYEGLESSEIILEADASTWLKYEGTIPCAACEGIKMQLLLENNPKNKENEFELTETYLGTKDGDRSFTSRGNYEVSYGFEENSSTMIITLYNENNQTLRTFIQEDDQQLLLLGNDGKKIESKLNYRLTKI